MDYQTRRLALIDAAGLRHLTSDQDDLITWAAGALDPETAEALARLFRAVRVDAFRAAVKAGAA